MFVCGSPVMFVCVLVVHFLVRRPLLSNLVPGGTEGLVSTVREGFRSLTFEKESLWVGGGFPFVWVRKPTEFIFLCVL